MSDIPSYQLRPCPPFTHVSLDFMGPFLVRGMGNSRVRMKVWGLILVCLNSKAVTLMATAGYITGDFRKFCA